MHPRLILPAALLLSLAPLTRAESPSHDARIAYLRQDLETALSRYQQNLPKPDAKLDSRELTYAAHDLLALGHPASEAEPLIQKAFDAQNMDPLSPAFGTFPWQINNPDIKDPNAVEFITKPLAPIFLLYGDKLSPTFKHDSARHLQAAAQGILHHKVPIDYTNIFLMKCANLYSLGLILKDRDLELGGIKGFREWFAYTRAHGIAEYNSPTYANTQLSCLLQTYRITTSPTLKKEIGQALDYTWTDLAANTFLNKNSVGGSQLAGPFSRTYDFLSGAGPFDRFLYAESLRNAPPAPTILVDSADPLLNELEHGYRPNAAILDIPRTPTRTLHQTFGSTPGQDRTTFITPNFAIGSASAEHGQQDRQLSISLAVLSPGKTLCDISVISETLDSPYGNKKLPDRSGHQKPTHLKNAAATVQSNGTVLALLDLAPALNTDLLKNPTTTLDTSILFPANADALFLDGKPLTLTPNQSVPITAGSWLIVREGKAAAAMRIFLADPVGGQTETPADSSLNMIAPTPTPPDSSPTTSTPNPPPSPTPPSGPASSSSLATAPPRIPHQLELRTPRRQSHPIHKRHPMGRHLHQQRPPALRHPQPPHPPSRPPHDRRRQLPAHHLHPQRRRQNPPPPRHALTPHPTFDFPTGHFENARHTSP